MYSAAGLEVAAPSSAAPAIIIILVVITILFGLGVIVYCKRRKHGSSWRPWGRRRPARRTADGPFSNPFTFGGSDAMLPPLTLTSDGIVPDGRGAVSSPLGTMTSSAVSSPLSGIQPLFGSGIQDVLEDRGGAALPPVIGGGPTLQRTPESGGGGGTRNTAALQRARKSGSGKKAKSKKIAGGVMNEPMLSGGITLSSTAIEMSSAVDAGSMQSAL